MALSLLIMIVTIIGIYALWNIYGNKALMVISGIAALICMLAIPLAVYQGEGYQVILLGILAILHSHSFFELKRESGRK